MFSTVLEKATSLFDRRALLSAFFPALIFWFLTVALIVFPFLGWNEAIKQWDGLNGTAQVFLLIIFFSWVAFWSFLTLNFRASIIRLYEGYWLTSGLSAVVLAQRQKYWQKQWDKLDQKDQNLEQDEDALLRERDAYKLLDNPTQPAQTSPQIFSDDGQQKGLDLDNFLHKTEAILNVDERRIPSTEVLQAEGEEIRTWWTDIVNTIGEANRMKDPAWSQRWQRLIRIKERFVQMTTQKFDEIQVQRLWLNRDLLLYYPPSRSDIMPTRLGNVIKAAESYTKERYHLDAVLIWSRLQSLLPKEFADSFQDTETSLDQMIILSASLLLFGIPFSVWLAFKEFLLLPWWVSLLITLVALILRCYITVGLALFALILTLLAPFVNYTLITGITQIQFVAILIGSVVLLSWLSYQNAIQVALDYGNKIKAAFDLYRWNVLEELHLQLPTSHEEEQKIWQEVCNLFYRSTPPLSTYYRYSKKEQTNELVHSSQTEET
jgi:hypothetical protein